MRRQTLIVLAGAALVLAGFLVLWGWADALAWVIGQQRQLHRDLAQALRGLAAGQSAAAWTLVVVSFVYGVLHAAGPGHGKMVISTYLATQEGRLRRGVALSVVAALLQGVVAIVLVDGLIWAVGGLDMGSAGAVAWSERAAFAVLALLGGLFAWRGLARLWRARATSHPHAHHHHDHDHPHDHGHDHHHHGEGCGCGHGPVATGQGWRATLAMVASIALRPCSGAVLVLALANTLDLGMAGMAAVMAMAVGTAITMSALALAVVGARAWMVRLAGGARSGPGLVGAWVSLAGGVLILAFAGSLLAQSFAPAHPLL